MRKMKVLLLALITMLAISACTENQRARSFGGTLKVQVEPGYKVTMATWKGEDLFYMMEEMEPTYVPKKKVLKEDATWGVIESKVVFIESRK